MLVWPLCCCQHSATDVTLGVLSTECGCRNMLITLVIRHIRVLTTPVVSDYSKHGSGGITSLCDIISIY